MGHASWCLGVRAVLVHHDSPASSNHLLHIRDVVGQVVSGVRSNTHLHIMTGATLEPDHNYRVRDLPETLSVLQEGECLFVRTLTLMNFAYGEEGYEGI
jgi:hypothetical protein